MDNPTNLLPVESKVRCVRANTVHLQSKSYASRLYGFDTAKAIACFAVILVHINPGTRAADLLSKIGVTFVVPFFMLASLRLITAKVQINPIGTTVSGIWNRIGVPYLIWTAIYFALRKSKQFATGESLEFDMTGVFLFGQSTAHLYFLPLLICTQTIAAAAFGLWHRRCLLSNICLAVVVSSYLFIGSRLNYTGWIFFPGVFVILFVFFWLYAFRYRVESQGFFGVLAVLLFFASQLYVISNGDIALLGVPVAFLVAGTSFYVMSFFLPKPPKVLFSSSTYGIFLSHILFLELIEFLIANSEWEFRQYSLPSKLLLAVTIYVLGSVFTSLARKSPIAARLLIGE